MKKKLNLLWNLKFNFFSVAERPLTFFAYFLNAKKVGRRRLVIVPATAGGLPLFPHAASAFTPALAPIRSHFTPRNRAGRSLPPPGATCSLPHFRSAQMWPRAPTPALAPVRSHFACGKTGLADHRPHLLELPRKIGRGISLRTPWAAVRFAAMASPPRTVIFPSPPQPRPQRHKAAVF